MLYATKTCMHSSRFCSLLASLSPEPFLCTWLSLLPGGRTIFDSTECVTCVTHAGEEETGIEEMKRVRFWVICWHVSHMWFWMFHMFHQSSLPFSRPIIIISGSLNCNQWSDACSPFWLLLFPLLSSSSSDSCSNTQTLTTCIYTHIPGIVSDSRRATRKCTKCYVEMLSAFCVCMTWNAWTKSEVIERHRSRQDDAYFSSSPDFSLFYPPLFSWHDAAACDHHTSVLRVSSG